MSYIKDKHIVYINSKNRLSGTNSNFSYLIDLSGTSKDFTHVVCLQALIHKSYYLIEDEENTFNINEDGLIYSVTIPVGNYNRRSFAQTLASVISTASFTYGNNYTYTVTYPSATSADTGKYTFTVSNNGAVQPIFIFSSWLYEQFGFESNTNYTFSANSLTSVNAVNLNLEDSLFIHSDICQNHGDNVLQEIYTAGASNFSSISFLNPSPAEFAKKLTTSGNNVYRFYLTDENGNEINLNGQNIVLSLMLFKTTTLHDLLLVLENSNKK